MSKTATLNVRVDANDKLRAEAVLQELGMPMSTLITLLLKQIALTQSIPFELALPTMQETMDTSKLTRKQLEELLLASSQAADAGDVYDMDEVFEGLRQAHTAPPLKNQLEDK